MYICQVFQEVGQDKPIQVVNILTSNREQKGACPSRPHTSQTPAFRFRSPVSPHLITWPVTYRLSILRLLDAFTHQQLCTTVDQIENAFRQFF